MAAKPRDLVTRFLSDVQGFLRGTDQVADALSDTARGLDQVADTGDSTSRRLAQAYDRAGDQLRRNMRKSTSGLKDDVKATGREVGNEFAQNLGQSLSSGDTSRIVQDSAGGLIGSLAFAGPLGAAVAAGGTIALSLWNGFSQKTEAQRQAVLDAAATIYDGLIAQGADFAKQYGQDVVREFFNPASTDEIAQNAKVGADALKMNLGHALAGGPDSIAAYAEEANKKVSELQETAARQPLTGDQAQQLQWLADQVAYLDVIKEGWDKATTRVGEYNQALGTSAYLASKAGGFAQGTATYRSQLGAAAPYATGTR